MKKFNRRKFLGGRAAVVASSAIPSTSQAAVGRRTTHSAERVVIIGSGFGGGISALRLAQAGVECLMLEKGRWWHTGPDSNTFPSAMKRVLNGRQWQVQMRAFPPTIGRTSGS